MSNYAIRFDEVSSTVSYTGKALPGSLTSEAVWQIKKVVSDSSSVVLLFANGSSEFDQIWDNRLSLSYS